MSNFKYQLSIASIMKYENDHVVEWIEYHHCIGVDHFYIYDNDENSGLPELLDYFINVGIVTLIPFPGELMQFKAYNDAINRYKEESKYIAFIDADEFISTNIDNTDIVKSLHDKVPVSSLIDNIFNKYSNHWEYLSGLEPGAIGLNWKVFGNNYHVEKPEGLIIENYTKYGETDFCNHIKSIINPRVVSQFVNPHFALFKHGYCIISQQGSFIAGPFFANPNDNPLYISHYYYKSKEEFENRMRRKKCDINISDADLRSLLDKNWKDVDVYNNIDNKCGASFWADKVKDNMIYHGYNPVDGQKL